MDIQDLHSLLSLSSTSPSSSISTSNLHLSSVDAERWKVGEKTAQQILSVIQPNVDSEKKRKDIIEYIQVLIEDSFGVKVYPFGSVPLKSYLPDGDVDLTVVCYLDATQDLAEGICNLLKYEEKNNDVIQVRDVLYVPAQVEVVKCTVGKMSIDISFNQTAGLCALFFLDQVDQFIGKDHLFKRSVILIKAWCYYESRILGGFYGLISSYALETLVLHLLNHFHSALHCPLAVLYKFLTYYSKFDWEAYCVSINGLVSISSLPEIEVKPPHGSDEVLLEDVFLRSSREAFTCYTGFTEIKKSGFPVKFLNILDPLRDDNNLGRCVSKGNFYRIRSALSYGTKKFNEVLTSQPEQIMVRLEKFFINTLNRNGRGKRADVCVSVPQYGAEISEISLTNGASDDIFSGIKYDMWFHNYGLVYQTESNKCASQEFWKDGWINMGQNEQNMYYEGNKSSLSSDDSAISLKLTPTGKSRGTGLFFPRTEHLPQRDIDLEDEFFDKVDSKTLTQKKSTTTDKDGSNAFDIFGDDFPLLPGSKPIPTKVSQSGYSKHELVDDSLASRDDLPEGKPIPTKVNQTGYSKHELVDDSLASRDDLMFGSLDYSSLESPTLSEQENQSISDISVNLDSSSDSAVPKELSNIEEKRAEKQPLGLADDEEFPPLIRPAKPEVILNKKEFPPLRASKSRKKFKEVPEKATRKEGE